MNSAVLSSTQLQTMPKDFAFKHTSINQSLSLLAGAAPATRKGRTSEANMQSGIGNPSIYRSDFHLRCFVMSKALPSPFALFFYLKSSAKGRIKDYNLPSRREPLWNG
jgi:hypothetical protein